LKTVMVHKNGKFMIKKKNPKLTTATTVVSKM
jgi:hypothetical protein